MSLDVNPAESSPAEPVAPPALDSLSQSDLTAWKQTGKFPSPAESSSSSSLAASTPAEPVEQAASTDATPPPASEPGMSETDSKPRKNAETRKEELNREIRELLARKQALQREVDDSRRPDPTPEPPAPSLTAKDVRPDLSKDALSEGEFFARFEGATYGDFTRYIARYEAAALRQSERATEQQQSRDQAFSQRMASALSADRDLLTNVPAKLLNATRSELVGADLPIRPMNIVAQEIYESDQPAALIRHFKDHPDELDALDRLPTHAAVVRGVAKIAAKLEAPSVPVVSVKTTSSAPPPPTTLGRKPAPAADELESAVKSGDFSRYRDEMNRRDLAARASQ